MAKASDNIFPLVRVAPGAAPSTPAAGQQVLYLDSGDSNKLKRKDSAGTVTTIEGGGGGGTPGAWTSWTPVLTAVTTNPVLGTASVAEGYYIQYGKIVHAWFNLQFGTSGQSMGSGEYRVSLPVTATTTGALVSLGTGATFGPNSTGIIAIRASSTTLKFWVSGAYLGPMTGAGSQIWATLTYEAA